MIKLSYALYELKPLVTPSALAYLDPRPGALLKVEWNNGRTGYADVHPWPELGDPNMEEQLAFLRKGKISALIEQAMWFAQRDAACRKLKKSLFNGSSPLRNNYIMGNVSGVTMEKLDEIKASGFQTIKVKVGHDLEEEVKFLNKVGGTGKFMIRLDFNALANWQVFESFMSALDKKVLSYIEYIEDPIPFDREAWKEAKRFGKIAIDHQITRFKWDMVHDPPFDVVIIKPARQDVDKTVKFAMHWGLRMTVTSSMDHPVGALHAYSVAQDLAEKHPNIMNEPGCMTQDLYRMNPYAAMIETQGPYIVKCPTTGVGFDQLLAQETWNPVTFR
ncbi:MAG: hypothetical protein V4736_16030 [Bdellovibrionota bacterium]